MKDLDELRMLNELSIKRYCTEEEEKEIEEFFKVHNEYPSDVRKTVLEGKTRYIKYDRLNKEQEDELIKLKCLDTLTSMNSTLNFFKVLVIINIIITIIALFVGILI